MKDLVRLVFDGHAEEARRFWMVFGVMSAINAGLLGLATCSAIGFMMTFLLAWAGIAISILWALIQYRLGVWCEWWDGNLRLLQEAYLKDVNVDRTALIEILPARRRLPPAIIGVGARTAGWMMPCIFALGWVGLLILSLTMYIAQW